MKKSMDIKKAASNLVKSAVTTNTRVKWTSLLAKQELDYVHEVVQAMIKTPEAAPYIVARKLREDLGLKTSHETIARTLKEMIANA